MKKVILLVSLFLSLPCQIIAQSSRHCTGKVEVVTVQGNNALRAIIKDSAGGVNINQSVLCSLSGVNGLISQEACKAIYSGLLASKTAGTDVTLVFGDSNFTCNKTWGSASDHGLSYFYFRN